MSFVRPEARAALWRWREVLSAAAMVVLGLIWALGPGGLLGWVGWAVVGVGLALGFVGFQRVRFRRPGSGPGTVEVDEGRITYFGPLTGGTVAASELARLLLDPTAKPPHWVLVQPGQPPLHIPVNADGSEALFDAFSALPGLRTERMLVELEKRGIHPVVIWERSSLRLSNQRLH